MAELTAPRETTVRKLFALSSNRCAFPDCPTPIVDRSTGTILGEICHIRAKKEGGPRFDPGQTSEARHSLQNLLLMCGVHHKVIDADENLSVHSVERLLEMKVKHEALAQAHEPEVSLTEDAVAALLEKVRAARGPTTHMDFRGAFFNAGGYGGGPLGGGGGGGIIHVVGITPGGFHEKVDLSGKPGEFPGGGGGGGLVFSGRLVSDEDIESGLRVSGFFFTNAVEVVNSLLYAMGAGWESYTVQAPEHEARINMATIIDTGSIAPNTLLALAIVVENPAGEVVASECFNLGVAEVMRPIMRQCFRRTVGFPVSEPGLWRFTLRSGDIELASTVLQLKMSDKSR